MSAQREDCVNEPYLSVIIPAYNEARRIGPTLRSVGAFLAKKSYSFEVIVVNDGSVDKTADVVRSLAAAGLPSLRILTLATNEGKGAAVRKGMLEARGEYRLFMDADNSTSIEHWERMTPYFVEGFDIVIGSRHVGGSRIAVRQSWVRESLGAIFRCLVRLIVPCGVADSQNGFKAFTAVAAQTLFANTHTPGWAFDVEVLRNSRRLGFKVKEVPVTWANDTDSKQRFLGMVRSLFDLVRIRIRG